MDLINLVVSGYIWRYAMKEKATIMFRGIRSWEQDGKEERDLYILNTWGPVVCGPLKMPLPTHFISGNPEYNHISSTLLRSICNNPSHNEEEKSRLLKQLVPEIIVPDIQKYYSSSS